MTDHTESDESRDTPTALDTYETCRDHGLKLRRMIGAENLERLQTLFQGY